MSASPDPIRKERGEWEVAFPSKRLSGPDALQQFALGGTVPLLEHLHDLPHPGAREVAVLGCQAEDHPGTDDGSAGAFHVTHTRAVGPSDVQGGLLGKVHEVAIGADDRLGAVM